MSFGQYSNIVKLIVKVIIIYFVHHLDLLKLFTVIILIIYFVHHLDILKLFTASLRSFGQNLDLPKVFFVLITNFP